MKAMVALSWMWGWKRFSALIVLGFESIARVGELLRARQSDLVLPMDLGEESFAAAFLRARKPKTMRRGKGRIQHIKVAREDAVRLLQQVFTSFSSFSFFIRSRWEKVLFALKVPKHLQPTPASIRGGGAIAAYRPGESIQSILMWRMRLLSLGSLESFLLAGACGWEFYGEVAKSRIRSAACFYSLALGHSISEITVCKART